MSRRLSKRNAASLAPLFVGLTVVMSGCGSNGCGLGLASEVHVGSTSSPGPVDLLPPGDSRSGDLNLTSLDFDQVDLSNGAVASGRVDAFLAEAPCDRLFDGPYDGTTAPAARCHIVLGPVSAGTVSAREKLPRGTFRLFVYAWTTNTEAVRYDTSVGIWSTNCKLVGLVPTR